MRYFFITLLFFLLNNCSFNKNSKFWNKNPIEKVKLKEKLEKINIKSENLMSLTFDEYEIFIDEYGKKSKYPNIN